MRVCTLRAFMLRVRLLLRPPTLAFTRARSLPRRAVPRPIATTLTTASTSERAGGPGSAAVTATPAARPVSSFEVLIPVKQFLGGGGAEGEGQEGDNEGSSGDAGSSSGDRAGSPGGPKGPIAEALSRVAARLTNIQALQVRECVCGGVGRARGSRAVGLRRRTRAHTHTRHVCALTLTHSLAHARAPQMANTRIPQQLMADALAVVAARLGAGEATLVTIPPSGSSFTVAEPGPSIESDSGSGSGSVTAGSGALDPAADGAVEAELRQQLLAQAQAEVAAQREAATTIRCAGARMHVCGGRGGAH